MSDVDFGLTVNLCGKRPEPCSLTTLRAWTRREGDRDGSSQQVVEFLEAIAMRLDFGSTPDEERLSGYFEGFSRSLIVALMQRLETEGELAICPGGVPEDIFADRIALTGSGSEIIADWHSFPEKLVAEKTSATEHTIAAVMLSRKDYDVLRKKMLSGKRLADYEAGILSEGRLRRIIERAIEGDLKLRVEDRKCPSWVKGIKRAPPDHDILIGIDDHVLVSGVEGGIIPFQTKAGDDAVTTFRHLQTTGRYGCNIRVIWVPPRETERSDDDILKDFIALARKARNERRLHAALQKKGPARSWYRWIEAAFNDSKYYDVKLEIPFLMRVKDETGSDLIIPLRVEASREDVEKVLELQRKELFPEEIAVVLIHDRDSFAAMRKRMFGCVERKRAEILVRCKAAQK